MEVASQMLRNFRHRVKITLAAVAEVDTPEEIMDLSHLKEQPVVPALSLSASTRRRQHEIRNRN